MPERPDPMTERLSRLTPNAAGLDRDAILFAAGRQSVRRSRLWPGVAGLLAIAQAVTLIALWPRSTETVVPATTPPAVQASPDIGSPPTSPPTDVWSIGSRLEVVQSAPSQSTSEFVPSDPPLTVGSGLRFD
jgi:hypothetical protein